MGVSSKNSAGSMLRAARSSSSPNDPSDTQIAKLRNLFQGEIEPIRQSPLYAISLVLVAIAMLLLVTLYAALIAGTLALTAWWAVAGFELLFLDKPRGFVLRIFAYVGVLIIGGTLAIFLIKPIFARRARSVNPYSLERHQEPLLFAFVDTIAEQIGAPKPHRIEIAPFANAAAGLHGGLRGIFAGRMDLLIGMPLITGLNTRQLAGVIAHELGHFSQRFGVRISYLISRINRWFERIVFERDSWDEKLEELSEDGVGRGWGSLIFLLARLCVWIVRKILFVFMFAGDVISSFQSRQMEFDADQCEVRIAGSAAFIGTQRQLRKLTIAERRVMGDLHNTAAERRLVDNLPALIAGLANGVSDEIASKPWPRQGWRGLFLSHPSDEARLKAATRTDIPGVFHLEKPATKLLRHADVIGKWITLGAYEWVLGSQPRHDALLPVESVLKREDVNEQSDRTARDYYFGVLHPSHRLFLDRRALEQAVSPRRAWEAVQKARAKLERDEKLIKETAAQFDKAAESMQSAIAARTLIGSDVRIKAASFGLTKSTIDEARAAQQRARQRMDELRDTLKPFRSAVSARLIGAFILLQQPSVRKRMDNADELTAEVARLHNALDALSAADDIVLEAHVILTQLIYVVRAVGDGAEKERLFEHYHSLERNGKQILSRLRNAVAAEPFPVEPGEKPIRISDYLRGAGGTGSDSFIKELAETGERYDRLYYRIMGRLSHIALSVENVAATMNPYEFPDVVSPVVNVIDNANASLREATTHQHDESPYRLEGE